MRIGLCSDVHGNLPALEAVLADLPDIDALVCAGDVVGYNPWPAECVDRLRDLEVPTVMGNHDRAVARETTFRFNAMAAAGVELARERLTDAQREWLASLPDERLAFDGQVKIVHGHPADPDRYTYPQDFSPRLLEDESVLVLGHTHVQHVERYAEGVVVNPGSVGQPRDEDPRAAYAVLDIEALEVETRRVAYDVERVQQAVAEAGLPEKIGSRLARGE
ncbi:metallophosphoesterase family protein [Natronosalvus halobius]|uniref:metallophosphoesterase family protein n=1 Tax=Natronosalvus halobius TaxID=2953746 RepID=UPI00209F24F2|nr:metallophosphoesterase family protein [Natronosalvus halobius]USZ71123.1 metallophosphatase family protein [Natronosalvus halobius]